MKEFFEHVSQMRRFFRALVTSGKVHENLELGRGHFARGIERRLTELPVGQRIPAHPRSAIAFAYAGALVSVLTWWVDHDMRQPPELLDELFHRMVWSGIGDYSVQ